MKCSGTSLLTKYSTKSCTAMLGTGQCDNISGDLKYLDDDFYSITT